MLGRGKDRTVATERLSEGWFYFAIVVIAGYLAVLYAPLFIGAAHGHDNHREWSQEAQNNPAIQRWWQDQRIPGGPQQGMNCCDEADGVFAEAEIRDDKWFVRFQIHNGVQVGWTEVPKEAVITTPNMYGSAVVWYGARYTNGNLIDIFVRCFIPGALT